MSSNDDVPVKVEGGELSVYAAQAADAREAMSAAAQDLGRDLRRLADPAAVTRAYPLATLGIAAGVGLLTALAVVPPRGGRTAARLSALEKAVQRGLRRGSGARVAKGSPAVRLGKTVFGFARPMLIRMALTALAGATGVKAAKATQDASEPPSPPPPPSSPQPPLSDVT